MITAMIDGQPKTKALMIVADVNTPDAADIACNAYMTWHHARAPLSSLLTIVTIGWSMLAPHKSSCCHRASIRCLTATSMTIGRPHSRLVSPGHLLVASMPILLPRLATGDA